MGITLADLKTVRKGDKLQLVDGTLADIIAEPTGNTLYIELPPPRAYLPTSEDMGAYMEAAGVAFVNPEDVESIIRPQKVERPGTLVRNLESKFQAYLAEQAKEARASKSAAPVRTKVA